MAMVLTFSGRSDGLLYKDEDGAVYKGNVLIEFDHDFRGSTISMKAEDSGIRITANADALFSYLTRVL